MRMGTQQQQFKADACLKRQFALKMLLEDRVWPFKIDVG